MIFLWLLGYRFYRLFCINTCNTTIRNDEVWSHESVLRACRSSWREARSGFLALLLEFVPSPNSPPFWDYRKQDLAQTSKIDMREDSLLLLCEVTRISKYI